MGGDTNELIRNLMIYIIPVIFAVTFHEAAHAYVAKWLGDDTAYMQGRVTLNPMSHIDPVGTVVLPLGMFILSGGAFVFGYAKPVPVEERRLRNPRADMPVVALAGPAANAIMALIWAILWIFVQKFAPTDTFFNEVAQAGIVVNILFFAFNMLPIMPLDGGRILKGLLPAKLADAYGSTERYGFFIVMALALFMGGALNFYWMTPVKNIIENLIRTVVQPLAGLLGVSVPF